MLSLWLTLLLLSRPAHSRYRGRHHTRPFSAPIPGNSRPAQPGVTLESSQTRRRADHRLNYPKVHSTERNYNSWLDPTGGDQPERPPGLFDYTPPECVSLSISPTQINVTEKPKFLRVLTRVLDDYSGVAKVEVEVSGRFGSDQASVTRSASYINNGFLTGCREGTPSNPVAGGTCRNDDDCGTCTYNAFKTGKCPCMLGRCSHCMQSSSLYKGFANSISENTMDVTCDFDPNAGSSSGRDLDTETFRAREIESCTTDSDCDSIVPGSVCLPMSTVRNTRHDGMWELKKNIPTLSANGTWLVSNIKVTDMQGNQRAYFPEEIKEISGGAVVYVYSGLCFTSPWLCEDPSVDPAAYSPLVGQWSIDPQGLGMRGPANVPNNSYDPLNKPSPNDNFALAIADDCTGNSGSSSSNCKGRGLSVLGIRQIFGAEGPVMPGDCAPKIDLTNGVPGTPDTYDCNGSATGDYRMYVYADPLSRRAVKWPQLHDIPSVRNLQQLVRQDDERNQKQDWIYSYYRRKWSNTPYCHRLKPDFENRVSCKCHSEAIVESEKEETLDMKNAARYAYLLECMKSDDLGLTYTADTATLVTKWPTNSKACRCDLVAFDLFWEDFTQIDEVCYKMKPMYNQPTEVCKNLFEASSENEEQESQTDTGY